MSEDSDVLFSDELGAQLHSSLYFDKVKIVSKPQKYAEINLINV